VVGWATMSDHDCSNERLKDMLASDESSEAGVADMRRMDGILAELAWGYCAWGGIAVMAAIFERASKGREGRIVLIVESYKMARSLDQKIK